MKNILASFAVVASFSQFACLFCCIVPTAAGVISLLAAVGLTGANGLPMLGDIATAFHPWRMPVLITALVMISLSWGLFAYNYLQSRKQKMAMAGNISCACSEKPVKRPYFLMAATALLIFNLVSVELLH